MKTGKPYIQRLPSRGVVNTSIWVLFLLIKIHYKSLTMNPTIDTSSYVGHVVADRKLRCQKPRKEPGGGGINVSLAIRILDGRSIGVFTAGGANGQLLQDLLQKESLNLYPVPIKGITRTNFTVLEKSSGPQFRFIMPGPKLDEREWAHCLQELSSVIPKPNYIIASDSLPRGAPVKSKVGAGDSMVAGIVLSPAQGKSLMEAVRFGVDAGSSAVMTPGIELCRGQTTEKLYNLLMNEQKDAEG